MSIRLATDTVYIDRWHTCYRDRVIETRDTLKVVQRDSIPYPVEVPIEVEKPVPRFYRHSTLAFWLLCLALLAYLSLRLYLRR